MDRADDPGEKEPEQKRRLSKAISIILHQWLLVGIGVVCVLAYYFPSVAKQGGVIKSQYSVLYGAIALIFLISGLSIPRQKLFQQFGNVRLHVLVQLTSYIVVPAVVVSLVHVIVAGDPGRRIDRALLAGYILTSCLPTTIASNVVMTRAAGGDEAAALVEVLVGNVLGPFASAGWTVTVMPKTAGFEPWRSEGGHINAMYRNVFKQLGLSLLLPLFVGQLIRWTWPDRTAKVVQKLYLPKVGTACLLLVIWTTFSTCFATGALQSLTAENIVFTALFNVALYVFLTAICFIISRPLRALGSNSLTRHVFHRVSPEETIAICFCGPAKSTAVGITLLYSMWKPVDQILKAKTAVPVLLYTTEQICVAHFFVYMFSRWRVRCSRKREGEDEPPSATSTAGVGVAAAAASNTSIFEPVEESKQP